MTYNLTNITEAQTFAQFLVETNTLVNGLYAAFFLIMLFVVLYILMQGYDTKTALLVPSFIIMILSSLFVFMGLIGWSAVVVAGVFMSALIIAVVWK